MNGMKRAVVALEKKSEDSLRCLRYEVEERFVRLRLASDAREDHLRQELGRANARAAAQSAEFAAARKALAGEVQRRMRAALLKKMLPVVRAQLEMELRDEVRAELRAELRAEAEAEAAAQLRESSAPYRAHTSARCRATVKASAENQPYRRAPVGAKSARRAHKLNSKRAPQRRVKVTAVERAPRRQRPAVSWRSPLCEIHSVPC